MTNFDLKDNVSKYKTKIGAAEYGWDEITSFYSIPLYYILKKYFNDPFSYCAQGFAKTFIQQHFSQSDGTHCIPGTISEFGSLVVSQFSSVAYPANSRKAELLMDISRIRYVYNCYENPFLFAYFSKHKKMKGLTLATKQAEATISEQDLIAGQNVTGMLTLLDTLTTTEFTGMLTRIHEESQVLILNAGIVPSLKEIRIF